MTPDFEELFAILTAHRVEFLVVGSSVLAFYGRPRYTEDVDIWVRRTRENIDRLADALDEFGTSVNRTKLYDLADKHDQMVVLGASPTAFDILNHIAGLEFDLAWENRQVGTLFGSKLSVLSLEDFRKSKAAAGRTKDLADLAILDQIIKDQGGQN